jgi:hypothetical protein
MPVETSEMLSRFILQSNWIRPSDSTVKPAAFLPNPLNGETSVFRTSGISEQDTWEIGDREVADIRAKAILGRADILAQNILSKNLQVKPSEPPPRHANIVGWPDEKSKRLQIAVELAADAQFRAKP